MISASPESQTRRILLFLIAVQWPFILWSVASSPAGVLRYLGFIESSPGAPLAWVLGSIIAIAYVWGARSISAVREHMFRWSNLKLLAIFAAASAGVFEEVVFRKWLMDLLHREGYGPIIQVVASGVAFGLAHLVWGAKSVAAGVNAMFSTAILGVGLAVVYLLGERSLAPCVVAHFAISSLIEPGLILAAVTNKLGWVGERA